jgi:hypothetical protein
VPVTVGTDGKGVEAYLKVIILKVMVWLLAEVWVSITLSMLKNK